MILFIFGISIIFIIYVEYFIGGILFRYNSSNQLTMNIQSMIHYLIHPFYNRFLWNLEIIHFNYIFILSISLILYYLYKFDFNTIDKSS